MWGFFGVVALGPVPQSGAQTMPPRAQDAFQMGNMAAQKSDWGMALVYFKRAHRAAHKHPAVLYALGTTHRALKHPVLAALFYKAYLEASPQAPNKAQVKRNVLEQIVLMDRLVRELYSEAFSAIDKFPGHMNKQKTRLSVLQSMVRAGEFEEAERLGRLYPKGTLRALLKAAMKLTKDLGNDLVDYEPDPRRIFSLAAKLSKYDARETARTESFQPMSVCVVGNYKCIARIRAARKKWKEDAPQRARLREAGNLVTLAFALKKSRFPGMAASYARKGIRILNSAGATAKKLHLVCGYIGLDEQILVETPNGCLYLGAGGEEFRVVYNPKYGFGVSGIPTRQIGIPFARTFRPSWIKILRKGQGPPPASISLDAPVYLDLAPLIRKQKSQSTRGKALGLARIAEKMARGRNLIRAR